MGSIGLLISSFIFSPIGIFCCFCPTTMRIILIIIMTTLVLSCYLSGKGMIIKSTRSLFVDAASAAAGGGKTTTSSSTTAAASARRIYKRVQVQLIHRHGDRSPITPMKNEQYWYNTLIPSHQLEEMNRYISNIVRDDPKDRKHPASGRGPFGKLTTVGLQQMIQLGQKLRTLLVAPSLSSPYYEKKQDEEENNDGTPPTEGQQQQQEEEPILFVGKQGENYWVYPYIYTHSTVPYENDSPKEQHHHQQQQTHLRPILLPHHIRVYSTDYERTIQSVQAVLMGLFPSTNTLTTSSATTKIIDDDDDHHPHPFIIDTRQTRYMIPDPEPRNIPEQEVLEYTLTHRPHVIQREKELLPLAIRTTKALQHLLGEGAYEESFGVGDDSSKSNNHQVVVDEMNHSTCIEGGPSSSSSSSSPPPLGWNQLSEIVKCLSVRNLLPMDITHHDVETIHSHAAWRWFETLRHPRLAYLSMNHFVQQQMNFMLQHYEHNNNDHQHQPHPPPLPMIIWSGHDSTLMGLMCAYHLDQPAAWPDYGSYLMIELLEVVSNQPEYDISTNPRGGGGDSSSSLYKNEKYWVRFSLNGQYLSSNWDGTNLDLIPLSLLDHYVKSVGSEPNTSEL